MLTANHSGKILEAGLDEAGRGCLAGPVVAAAVILPPDYHHPLLTDSKQLTKEQRERLRGEITKVAVAWAVGEVSHTEIDEINILNASFRAMHRAVAQLTVVPEYLIVDGNRFNPYPDIAHTCIVKGDGKYFSIAAASVLAKTYRDDLMAALAREYPHFGWEHNAGYPTIKHRDAIRVHGTSPYHRLSFRLLPDEIQALTEEELITAE
jgi:ribonuclease HII